MKLLVNGEMHEVTVDPDTPLLYVLRNDLGLVGTRFGCGLGLCGACTVLLDGRPAAACDTPLWSVGERAVTTVESLGPPERPGRLPQAILDHQAAQCGYCVSGMLMTATSLLAQRPDADEATVRAALDGHLCRCGAHNRIVRAVLDAAGPPPPPPPSLSSPPSPPAVVVAGTTVERAGGPVEELVSASLRANPKPSRWLAFEADRTVTVRSGKVELGQGILTALAQVAAAELGVAPTRIRMAGADTAVSPDEGLTAGSHSIEESALALRLVGAQVRERCRAAAAERLGDPVSEVGLVDGAFTGPSGTLTYWDLPTATLLDRDADPTAPNPGHDAASVSRTPVRHDGTAAGGRVGVGAPLARVDLPAKVTGGRRYLADLTWPDLVHARVARPPALGSTLVEARTAAAAGLAGVRRVVVDGSLLAVLADREEIAIRAAERLRRDSRWSPGTPLPADLRQLLWERPLETVTLLDTAAAGTAAAGTAAAGTTASADADADADADAVAPGSAAMTVAARYGRGALAHASIGTATAVALDRDGVLRVWTHSQGVFALRAALAGRWAGPRTRSWSATPSTPAATGTTGPTTSRTRRRTWPAESRAGRSGWSGPARRS
jgi:aerobic-type carbon monoxide dehydrogenase small subunit (CoxS/CutS family)